MTDDVFTDYHSFQGEVRRRFRGGVFGQLNYTFSKVLSNSTGTANSGFEPALDNNRPELEKRRADFDRTHILNANVVYELPFGPGKRFLGAPLPNRAGSRREARGGMDALYNPSLAERSALLDPLSARKFQPRGKVGNESRRLSIDP